MLARFEARSAATPGNAKLAVDFRIERRHLYDLAHYQAKAADGITNQRQHTFETAVKRAIRAAMLAFDQPTSEALALAWIRINRPTRQALIQISGLGEAECDRLLAMQEIHPPQVTDKALARYAFGPALYAINKAGKLVARDDVIRPQIATIALDESGTPRAGKAFDNPNTDYAPIAYGVVDDLFDRTFGNGGARAPKEEATAPTANAVDLADLESKVKEGAITMQEAFSTVLDASANLADKADTISASLRNAMLDQPGRTFPARDSATHEAFSTLYLMLDAWNEYEGSATTVATAEAACKAQPTDANKKAQATARTNHANVLRSLKETARPETATDEPAVANG